MCSTKRKGDRRLLEQGSDKGGKQKRYSANMKRSPSLTAVSDLNSIKSKLKQESQGFPKIISPKKIMQQIEHRMCLAYNKLYSPTRLFQAKL